MGQILAWTDGNVTPETGQTTTIYIYAEDGTTLLNTIPGITGTAFDIPDAAFMGAAIALVVVGATRTDADGTFDSLQNHGIWVQLAPIAAGALGASGSGSAAFVGLGASLSAGAMSASGVASAPLVGEAASDALPGAPYPRAGYTEAFGGGNITTFDIAYPAVLAVDDVAFLHIMLSDAVGTSTINTPSGWTSIAQTSIGGTSSGFHHAVFWKRLTGSESGNVSPTFAAAGLGTFYHAAITIWRGCVTSGTPYELLRSTRGTGTNTGMNAVNTTNPDRTFLNFIGRDGSVTCAEAQSFTEHYDLQASSGAGAILHYLQTTTPNGFYENATLSGSVRNGSHSIALIPQTTVSSGTVPSNDTFFSLVKLLAGFESSIADESSSARTLTAGGNAQRSTAQSKFGSASALFDGTGDYVSAADSADWDFAAQPFTIELFARMSTKTNSQAFLGQWSTTSTAFYLYLLSGALTLRTTIGSNIDVTFTWTPTLNQWYHIAAERDVAGKTRLYIDGSMVASAFTQAGAINNSTDGLTIGAIGTAGAFSSFDYNGYQDEIRITKGIARYATDTTFTVPAAAFPRT